MEAMEPKKLALLRILQILQKNSDRRHPLTQEEIAAYLERDYGIVIERKAVSRNLSLLREAGYDVESDKTGSWLGSREFDNEELRLLIDGVLCSQYISARQSSDLIDRLCGLSSRYFLSHIRYIHSVGSRNKTENSSLFYNIKQVDAAIEAGRQLRYDYNKYGLDKRLHHSSTQTVTPYQMLLHNQHYYLMARSERWGDMAFHRLDHITNPVVLEEKATPLTSVKGYEKGIDYKALAETRPYLYNDTPETVELLADTSILDALIERFGKGIRLIPEGEDKVRVSLTASPQAMEYWALQYAQHAEVLAPVALREKLRDALAAALARYQ